MSDYAVIGNCRTLALVSRAGSVDWMCVPDFSSPSLFAALLDRHRGGRFIVTPLAVRRISRRYLDGTAILETTFQCESGEARLVDFMPMFARSGNAEHGIEPQHEVARILQCTHGRIEFQAECDPRPGYAAPGARLHRRGALGWFVTLAGGVCHLASDAPFEEREPGSLRTRGVLRAGEESRFLLRYSRGTPAVVGGLAAATTELERTRRWWHAWSGACTYRGQFRDSVLRSAITLKLLTYGPSGAVLAAGTTSLPAGSGGRCWDYRYCWLRDSSLTLQSFVDLGFVEESAAYLRWLLHATRLTWPRLQPVYDVFGRTWLAERRMARFEGWRGQGPVRVGNGASTQLQLDLYGEVMLTAYGHAERGGRLDVFERRRLLGFGRSVMAQWHLPDQSIWEARVPARHNTFSKVMCWVALDRLLALDRRFTLGMDAAGMAASRDAIRREVESRAWDEQRQSYVAYYGASHTDASLLLMARYGFLDPRSPRMSATARRIVDELSDNGLLYRYPRAVNDGVGGSDNLFMACSFWLVDYLARAGDLDAARSLFARLIGLANDVGLLAEQVDPGDLSLTGNFPQAFSHTGLIAAALAIEHAAEGRQGTEIPG